MSPELDALFRNTLLSYRPPYGLFSCCPLISLSYSPPMLPLHTGAMPRVAAVREVKVMEHFQGPQKKCWLLRTGIHCT